jgi:ribosomal subunit interface protein
MVIEYVVRGYSLDESVKGYLEKKLRKVLRFVDEPIAVHAVLETEKHQAIAEVHLTHRLGVLHSREAAEQMLDAINLAVDNLETQAQRAHEKLTGRRRRGDRAATAAAAPEPEPVAPEP